MLLTKEVEIKWSNIIIKYYKDKGYSFTKKGDPFICKIEDLSEKSTAIVDVECDYCGKLIHKPYVRYIKERGSTGKDCCVNCAPKKMKETCKIKYGDEHYGVKKALIKFEEYNLSNQKIFINKMITNSKKKGYLLLPFVYINANEKIPFICTKHIDDGIQYGTAYNLSIETRNNCYSCMCEKISENLTFSYDEVKDIIEHNGKNKLISDRYTSAKDRNLEILCANCMKNTYITSLNKYTTSNHIMCNDCGIKMRSGENHFNWNGGITKINSYLRNAIKEWKEDSLKHANYKCDISGKSGNLAIHHLTKSFRDIVKETFEIIGIDIYPEIKYYTLDELELISKTCLELHYKYGLGVCMLNEYHVLFHTIYGKFNNTIEQYNEFKNDQRNKLYST